MKSSLKFSRQFDSINKLPIVELAGENHVLVENHLGVVAYSLNEISIKLCYGIISIMGENLHFMKIQKDQLVIHGRIDCISLIRG